MLKTGENLCLDIHTTPSTELAAAANGIGYYAWRERFAQHGMVAIRQIFDPHRPDQLLARMRQAADVGRFAGIVAVAHDQERDTQTPVGVLWAADGMGPYDAAQRMMYRAVGRRPEVLIAQASVLPDHQRQGIGTAMLATALEQFSRSDISAMRILSENEPADAWARKAGYEPWPPETTKSLAFGTAVGPLDEQRMSCFVSTVQFKIGQQYAELPADTIAHVA